LDNDKITNILIEIPAAFLFILANDANACRVHLSSLASLR
jgi:hypothetical protein